MIKKLRLLLIFFTLLFSSINYAENMLVDVNLFYTVPDAGGNDDFHTGKIPSINFNYYYQPWLAFTAGIYFSEEIFDNTQTDIVGTFQASIESQGLMLGVRPEYKFSERNKVYARTGLLTYKTKVTVREFFEPGLPFGTTSDSADGTGYYFTLGWAHSFTPSISFQLEFGTQKQLDLFDGKTTPDRVFDLTLTGFSLGLGYAF